MRSPTEDAAVIRDALDDNVLYYEDVRALAKFVEELRNDYQKWNASIRLQMAAGLRTVETMGSQ